MAKEIINREIDGNMFTFGQLPPTKSVRLLVKMAKIMGVSLASMAGADPKSDIANMAFDKAAEKLLDRIDDNIAMDIIKSSLEQTFVMNQGIKNSLDKEFDVYFAEYGVMHILKVVKTAWEVQFPDFFGEKGLFAGFKPKAGATALNP
jgi:hypothetical protein